MGRNLGDFYHGSAHHFKPGDMVLPKKDIPGQDPSQAKNVSEWNFAWASTNRNVAASYGRRLYRVEPPEDVKRQPGASKEFGIYNSQTGFKVIEEVDRHNEKLG